MKTTITFEKDRDMMNFLNRCVYHKASRFDVIPRFFKMEVWPNFKQIIVDDYKESEQIEEMMKENKVNYKFVTPW